MEILFLHPGGLGDVILSLPAIALLRHRFPTARVTIAGNLDHIAPIMSGYAECVISLSTLPLHYFYAQNGPPQEESRVWKSFDRIVSWTGSGDSKFVRNLKNIHPDACIASWKPEPGEHRHVSRLFVDSMGLEVPSGENLKPARILLNRTVRDEGQRWLTEHGWNGRHLLTALHPGAGSKAKRWPLHRFVGLARHLALQEKRKLLIIEGPAEPGLAAQLAQNLAVSHSITAEHISLDLLAAVVEQCSFFVGNDSGIAHLAAALGVPSIVLFGPTAPQHWAPLGRHVIVLRNQNECEGCTSGGNNHTCLSNISVEEVVRALESLRLEHRTAEPGKLRGS